MAAVFIFNTESSKLNGCEVFSKKTGFGIIEQSTKTTGMRERQYVKVGIAGPVGSGKTALIERLSRELVGEYSIGVITNDIYTKEDAEYLTQNSLLPAERII